MRALLIGGNGFIGSHLLDELIQIGWKLRVLDHSYERFRAPHPEVEFMLGRYEDPAFLQKALLGIDYVFHLASTTLPKSSNEDPTFDVASNLIQTIHLLEACVKQRIRKVVFLSSGGTVYGTTRSVPIHEEHATDPECSYGITKLAIEKYLALFKHLYGLDYVILRPSNPYGIRQNPFGTQGAIPVFLRKVKLNQPIEIWGDGSTIRDYIHVKDLVNGIRLATTVDSRFTVFNLGSGEGHSLIDIVNAIEHVIGRTISVTYSERRIFDTPKVVLDITRARNELNWSPIGDLHQGIDDVWKFIESTPRKSR